MRLAEVVGRSERVYQRFHRNRAGLRGAGRGISESEVDFSLACMLAWRGLEGAAIEHAVRMSRETAGLPGKRETYYKATVEKAVGVAGRRR